MKDKTQYGFGQNADHHPQQGAESLVDPATTSSTDTSRKKGTAVFQAGWHGAGPNPLNALDEGAYFPNLQGSSASRQLRDTRMAQSAWSSLQNDITLAYGEDEFDFPEEHEL